MAMEHGPCEDVFPIEDGNFSASHVSLLECTQNTTNLRRYLDVNQNFMNQSSGQIIIFHQPRFP